MYLFVCDWNKRLGEKMHCFTRKLVNRLLFYWVIILHYVKLNKINKFGKICNWLPKKTK